jgi:hypothetical protein
MNLDKVRILFIIHQKSQIEISNQLKIKWDSAFYEVCTVRQPKYWHWLILGDWLWIWHEEHACMLQSQITLVNSNFYLREILCSCYNSFPEITILLISVGLVKNSKVVRNGRTNYSFELRAWFSSIRLQAIKFIGWLGKSAVRIWQQSMVSVLNNDPEGSMKLIHAVRDSHSCLIG